MPLWGMAIGAAVGVVKSETVDKQAADTQRAYQAATAKWAPWTGMTSHEVAKPNDFNSALTFGATGAQVGAAAQKSANETKLTDATTGMAKTDAQTDSLGSKDMTAQLAPKTLDQINAGPTTAGPKDTPIADYNAKAPKQDPSWFFGQNPTPYGQPTGQPANPYQSMYNLGIDPNAPYQGKFGPWGGNGG